MVTPYFSRNSLVYPSTRVRLDSMSGLPPGNAPTTVAPVTWFGVFGSLSTAVNAGTCEVSSPIIPMRNASVALAMRVRPRTSRSFARNFIEWCVGAYGGLRPVVNSGPAQEFLESLLSLWRRYRDYEPRRRVGRGVLTAP